MKSFVTQKVFAAAIAASLASPAAYAAAAMPADNGIMPCYEIATSASSTLSFSGTTATCYSRCSGAAVSITAVQTLQKEGLFWIWSDVDDAEWTKSVSVATIAMTNTKSGLSTGTYRLKTEFTLTNSSGETETITVYSTEEEL